MNTFVRVAELGSLSAAARDLGLSQPAVSRQLAALETRLNVRLIHRTTRGLALTAAGESYYRRANEILEALQEAEDDATTSHSALAGSVRVHAPTGFGQTHVAPALIKLQQKHPALVIELMLDDRLADLAAEGVDVAIRLGAPRSPGLVIRPLGRVRRLLAASKDYAQRNGLPTRPEDLKEHPFVRFSWALGGDELRLVGPDGPVSAATRAAFVANNSFALIAAVRAGIGIGAVQAPLVHHLLASGELVEVLSDFSYPPLELNAVYPSRRFIPSRVRTLISHLVDELVSTPGLA